MKATTNYFLHLAIVFLIASFSGTCLAASQGSLGKTSSGSVEISVHVSQTLNTVSPNELLLNQSSNSLNKNSKPFCIAHYGFNQNAGVPYKLKVDNLFSAKSNDAFPYKVYLEDNHSFKNKLPLAVGMSVPKQSNITISKDLQQECVASGLSLSIEMSEKHKNNSPEQLHPGLMLLMVEPI